MVRAHEEDQRVIEFITTITWLMATLEHYLFEASQEDRYYRDRYEQVVPTLQREPSYSQV
jgi:hypothetical protein